MRDLKELEAAIKAGGQVDLGGGKVVATVKELHAALGVGRGKKKSEKDADEGEKTE